MSDSVSKTEMESNQGRHCKSASLLYTHAHAQVNAQSCMYTSYKTIWRVIEEYTWPPPPTHTRVPMLNWVGWCMPGISALRRLKQEDQPELILSWGSNSVKYLPCKHQDLSLSSSTHVKGRVWQHRVTVSAVEKQKWGIPGTHQLASLD